MPSSLREIRHEAPKPAQENKEVNNPVVISEQVVVTEPEVVLPVIEEVIVNQEEQVVSEVSEENTVEVSAEVDIVEVASEPVQTTQVSSSTRKRR
jgi:hypothetical protein